MRSIFSHSVLIFTFISYSIQAEVITYFPAPEVKASEWYQAKVNDKDLFVYDSKVTPFTNFDMDGEVIVEIDAKREIMWLDIRPKNLGLTYTLSGSNIKIKVAKPCQFSVELNGMPNQEALLVFANPIEKNKPSAKDPNVIFFGTGKYHKAGVINVKSGQTVYIEGGAIVEGLIRAENAQNIKVDGRGILDGWNNQTYKGGNDYKFIQFKDCKNVTLSGITLIRSVTWEVVPTHCSDVLIDNIHIVSENGGDDGIDIVRTRNITIQNSFIRSKDDNIVVKCIWKYPDTETTENVLVKNCVLWNTIWGNAIEIGFELAADTVKNIRFENCDIIHNETGAAFSIHNTDYTVIENIVFENIRVEEATQKLFDISIFFSKYSNDNTFTKQETSERYLHGIWDNAIKLSNAEKVTFAKKRGWIKDITFKDIYVTGGPLPFSDIIGYDKNHLVSNILFKNVIVLGKKMTSVTDGRFFTQFAENIVFE